VQIVGDDLLVTNPTVSSNLVKLISPSSPMPNMQF
jgi:hypothetical protein